MQRREAKQPKYCTATINAKMDQKKQQKNFKLLSITSSLDVAAANSMVLGIADLLEILGSTYHYYKYECC